MSRTLYFIFHLILLSSYCFSQSNSDTLRKHVVRLSTLPYGRNSTQPETLYDASEYIQSILKRYTTNIKLQQFEIRKQRYHNIICSFGPDTAGRIIVGAHYDAYKNTSSADNNASGVAGLLELARLLGKVSKHLAYRIDLVAFAPSEPPFFNTEETGSTYHAKYLIENKFKVHGMINLVGLGYFSDKKKSQKYPFIWQNIFYTHKGNFISALPSAQASLFNSKIKYQLKTYAKDLPFKYFQPIIPFPILKDGDHKSYSNLGIPSLLISNTLSFRNKFYRKDIDNYSTLDYIRMSKTVDMVYMSLLRYH